MSGSEPADTPHTSDGRRNLVVQISASWIICDKTKVSRKFVSCTLLESAFNQHVSF
jgi:hypothetical protein